MIYDKIENIRLYLGTSKALDFGFNYILNVDESVPLGLQIQDYGVKVIVTEYESMLNNPNGYEAHRQYIDIQFPIVGTEIIRCKPIEALNTTLEDNAEKDYVQLEDNDQFYTQCKVGNGYFAVLYPNDSHEPQLCIDRPEHIKKVILKIPVEL